MHRKTQIWSSDKKASTYPIKEDFLRATESQGIPTVDDLQDLVTGHGAEHWLKWINRDVSAANQPTQVPWRL